MTASVLVDPASPCFGQVHWPERAYRVEHLTAVENGDGTVTATAVPYGDKAKERTVSKTVTIDTQTQVKAAEGQPALRPAGGVIRWRVTDNEGNFGDVVFSQKAKADARADAVNKGEVK